MPQFEVGDVGAESQAPKFSRYRSVRGKGASSISNHVGADANDGGSMDAVGVSTDDLSASASVPAPDSSVTRSMSRYRRRAASVSVNNDTGPKIRTPPSERPPMPPVPPILPSLLKHTSNQGNQQVSHGRLPSQKENNDSPIIPQSAFSPHQAHHQLRQSDRNMADNQSRPKTARDEVHRAVRREDRERRSNEENYAVKPHDHVAQQDMEVEQLIARQKRKDLERLQVQLANAPQAPALRPHKPRSPVVEKFVMMTRRKKSKEGLSPTSSTAGSVSGSAELNHSHAELPEVPKLPTGIEVGGKGIVPQKDAPISAVNAGDRIVSVRCRHHNFILPVTPDTTSNDIIMATAKHMTYDLEWKPSDCVVLESYGPLGLQRRIRRYEHIRDVMNSWDRDTHNHLIVSVSDDVDQDRDLDVASVPDSEEAPKGIQLYMYHSNRPGKWSKRWVTLTDSGQVLCSKKPDTTSSDKDTLSLCHLSDYDIYTPIESQMRRRLKPPKKHCYAVKSQHKPSMFMNTDNYVQYFCTEDPNIAAQFSEKLQAWRSWYLVDRRPTVRRISIPKTDDKPPQLTTTKPVTHSPKKSVNVAAMDGHLIRVSVDETPYAIGEFEPLLDMKRFDKRLSQFGKDFLPIATETVTKPKPSSPPKRGSQEKKSEAALIDSIKSGNDDAFTGNGLLGELYEDRKAANAVLEKEISNKLLPKDFGNGAFIEGPSLLNKHTSAGSEQRGVDTTWFPSALEHSAKRRDIPDRSRPNTSAGTSHATRPTNPRSRSHSRPPPVPQQNRLRTERSPRPDEHARPLASQHSSPVLGSSAQMPPSRRGQAPKPLLDLAPTINEPPPQWARKGHGVQAPDGLQHLVDLISVGTPKGGPSGLLEVPPRNPMRRGPISPLVPGGSTPNMKPAHRNGSGGLGRTRSKSSGAPPSRLLPDVPPVPLVPGRNTRRGTGDRSPMETPRVRDHMDHREHRGRERERERGRARDRDMAGFNSVPGRVGTLKVV